LQADGPVRNLATGTLDDPILFWGVPGPLTPDGAHAAEKTTVDPGGQAR
jgi:hypothetical protein